MTNEVYLPWAAGACAADPEYFSSGAAASDNGFVHVTAVLHGKAERSVSLLVPPKLTCADLKGHLAMEGVVSTCGGLSVALEEGGQVMDDSEGLTLAEGQVVHLQRAAEMVSVTVLTTADRGGACEHEDVYELALPGESTGALLKEQIAEATAGSLKPVAIFMARGDDDTPYSIGDEEQVKLEADQVIIVQRSVEAPQQPAAAAAAVEEKPVHSGLLGKFRSRFMGAPRAPPSQGPPAAFCLRAASNIKVKGSLLSCASKEAWAGCAVFDVPDPAYFEITVRLVSDAPAAEAEGLAGRWMLGVVPSAVAEVRTERQRKRLIGLGHWLTVCHGHPAKIHAPSMPRGTCGEDCPALPGELQKDQTLTLRWALAGDGGTLMAQVDDGDAVSLQYSPAPFDDVRPCLVFGGRPADVRVLQLDTGRAGGA